MKKFIYKTLVCIAAMIAMLTIGKASLAKVSELDAADYDVTLWHINFDQNVFEFRINGSVDRGNVDLGNDPDVSFVFYKDENEIELTFTSGGDPDCDYDKAYVDGSVDCSLHVLSSPSALVGVSFVIKLENGSNKWESPELRFSSCDLRDEVGGTACVKGNYICIGDNFEYGSEDCVDHWKEDAALILNSKKGTSSFSLEWNSIDVMGNFLFSVTGPLDLQGNELSADGITDIIVLSRYDEQDDLIPHHKVMSSCKYFDADSKVKCSLYINLGIDSSVSPDEIDFRILARSNDDLIWLSPVFDLDHCDAKEGLENEGFCKGQDQLMFIPFVAELQMYSFPVQTEENEPEVENEPPPEDEEMVVEDVEEIVEDTDTAEPPSTLLPPQYIIGNDSASGTQNAGSGGGCSLSATRSPSSNSAIFWLFASLVPVLIFFRRRHMIC